jgi:diguanylate cyclase (GGDEF)-like protein
VLVQLARILKRHVRALDAFARWGGEEFIVALPSTPADGAFVAAERIRAAVESEPIRDPRGVAVSVTVSVGVAEFRPDDSIERLVERADVAMYRAKSSGRNRVVSATSSRSLVPHSVESASRVDARGA